MTSIPYADDFDAALDAGRLWVRSRGRGKWYRVRRNGATKRWKRQPGRFRIPVKVGLRQCLAIDEGENGSARQFDWCASNADPNTVPAYLWRVTD